jgi:hypothetical protein
MVHQQLLLLGLLAGCTFAVSAQGQSIVGLQLVGYSEPDAISSTIRQVGFSAADMNNQAGDPHDQGQEHLHSKRAVLARVSHFDCEQQLAGNTVVLPAT